MPDIGLPGALLPLLEPREVWAVGLVIVFAVLRPTGRPGWGVATSLIAGAVVVMAALVVPELEPGSLWQLIPWLVLAGLLVATVAGQPLRWEPRTGPSAATALLFGALVIHVGLAWHAGGVSLVEAGREWGSGDLQASSLPQDAAGPLLLPAIWVLQLVPGLSARAVAATVGLLAAAAIVAGAGTLARKWGYTGTARATAASVAWAPPILLAHGLSPGGLISGAALVWSWWALGEVWSGRHRPDRMALLSGALLGVAVGISVWPLIVLPLWLGRYRGRRAGWFVVGIGAALLATVAALLPTAIGIGDVWQVAAGDALSSESLPGATAVVVVIAAIAAGVLTIPLSPTRSSALSAAVLTLAMPWWPEAWAVTGPVAAIPFVLLAAVAPDQPGERWPPDAPVEDLVHAPEARP